MWMCDECGAREKALKDKKLLDSDNNTLIAIFMGCTKGKPGESRWTSDWFDRHGNRITDNTRQRLLFNTSWDWLMPVVEKIWEAIGNRESLFYFESDDISVMPISEGLDNMADCYAAVVTFIHEYNNNK